MTGPPRADDVPEGQELSPKEGTSDSGPDDPDVDESIEEVLPGDEDGGTPQADVRKMDKKMVTD